MSVVIKKRPPMLVIAPIRQQRVRLIRIREVEQSQINHCENCGCAADLLYWSGNMMRCVGCDKSPLIDKGIDFRTFKDRLEELVGLDILGQLPRIKEWIRE